METLAKPVMIEYLDKVKQMLTKFEKVELKQCQWKQNCHVDALTKIVSSIKTSPKRTIPIEFLFQKSIAIKNQVSIIDE